MAAATCFLNSLFFIQWVGRGEDAPSTLIVTELLPSIFPQILHSLARFFRFGCGELTQLRHGRLRRILPIAVLVAPFRLGDVMVLRHRSLLTVFGEP